MQIVEPGGFSGSIVGPTGALSNAIATFTLNDGSFSDNATIDAMGNFGLGYIPTGDYHVEVQWGIRSPFLQSAFLSGPFTSPPPSSPVSAGGAGKVVFIGTIRA